MRRASWADDRNGEWRDGHQNNDRIRAYTGEVIRIQEIATKEGEYVHRNQRIKWSKKRQVIEDNVQQPSRVTKGHHHMTANEDDEDHEEDNWQRTKWRGDDAREPAGPGSCDGGCMRKHPGA